MKLKLTDRYIASIKPPISGQDEYRDTLQRGLQLRVTARDVRTWCIQLRVDGRMRRFTIGRHPEITLSEARRKAGKMVTEVLEGKVKNEN